MSALTTHTCQYPHTDSKADTIARGKMVHAAGGRERSLALLDGRADAALSVSVQGVANTVRSWKDIHDLQGLVAALPRVVYVVRAALNDLDGEELGVDRAAFACRFADLVAPVLCNELWMALLDADLGARIHPGHKELVNLAVHSVIDTLLVAPQISDRDLVDAAGWAIAGLK